MKRKLSKTEKLVLALSKKEADEFSGIISLNGRPNLAVLYDGIRSGPKRSGSTDKEKERLFWLVFKKKHTKENDFLLRNEQRLLAKEIMRFLARKQSDQELKNSPELEAYHYLMALKEHGEMDLFISEWPKALKVAQQNHNHQIGHRILRSVIEHLAETSKATVPEFDEIQKLIDTAILELNSAYLLQFLRLKMKESFVQRTKQALGVDLTLPELELEKIEIDDPKISSNLSNFYLEMCRSFRQAGPEKIDTLIRSIGLLEKVPKTALDRDSTIASINAGIALEYFLNGELHTSIQYHEQALENSTTLSDDRKASYLFNYISTLLRLERYSESIDLIRLYEGIWMKRPRLKHRFQCLLAMCLIFENRIEEVESLIPEDRKDGGMDHYYYFRIIHTITLFLRDKPDLSLNELDNLEHTVRYNDSDRDTLSLIQGFRKLFNLICDSSSLSESEIRSAIDQLNQVTAVASKSAKANHWLLYHWMNQRIALLTQ